MTSVRGLRSARRRRAGAGQPSEQRDAELLRASAAETSSSAVVPVVSLLVLRLALSASVVRVSYSYVTARQTFLSIPGYQELELYRAPLNADRARRGLPHQGAREHRLIGDYGSKA